MSYKYSSTDNKNINWFSKDDGNATLLSIKLKGVIRSLSDCEIEFKYPLTVISGKNGSGKSTWLAMAACGFHNSHTGFKLKKRENHYYTFSDFLIQSVEDVKPEGIYIAYGILHNNWRKTQFIPTGKGLAYQTRRKKKGGRWNNYERRVKRDVVVLGIDRVVPHSEISIHKSYKSKFKGEPDEGIENDIRENVGYILEKDYSNLKFKKYYKYKLPIVVSDKIKYSGFNMGAGENALFELFYILHKIPNGGLIIIDELELGLHEAAQTKLIKVLKELCLTKKIQIICTSHSPEIIRSVPPEGRIHIEKRKKKTKIIPGISSEYATGKLRGENSNEIDVYVEDYMATLLLNNAIPNSIRKRVSIIPIGSDISVVKQMAARYNHKALGKCICFLDGDKRIEESKLTGQFVRNLETVEKADDMEKAKTWISERMFFLPGKIWPEKWICEEMLKTDLKELSIQTRCTKVELKSYLKMAIQAGKHNEFYELCKLLNIEKDVAVNMVINSLRIANPTLLNKTEKLIKRKLD